MMRLFTLTLLACSAVLSYGQSAPGCQAISADQITGKDLAAALPQMALVPPDLKIGYAPAPGAIRILGAAQLQQLATKYGIAIRIAGPVCFAWPLRILSRQELLAALTKSLGGRQADLEITGQSNAAVPEGELHFPAQGLSSDSSKPTVWSGYVVYAGNRKFNTWVQVRITVHEQQLVAARAIPAGELITLSALKKVDYAGPIRSLSPLREEKEAVGQCARWSIAADTVLTLAMVSPPLDIRKDQLVTVHISCGGASIETQGIAADAGYIGNVIRVRNPTSGRIFRAIIDDRGVVTVVAGGQVGLAPEGSKT
jgi:flagella basal body P-ring formation protein FlgA